MSRKIKHQSEAERIQFVIKKRHLYPIAAYTSCSGDSKFGTPARLAEIAVAVQTPPELRMYQAQGLPIPPSSLHKAQQHQHQHHDKYRDKSTVAKGGVIDGAAGRGEAEAGVVQRVQWEAMLLPVQALTSKQTAEFDEHLVRNPRVLEGSSAAMVKASSALRLSEARRVHSERMEVNRVRHKAQGDGGTAADGDVEEDVDEDEDEDEDDDEREVELDDMRPLVSVECISELCSFLPKSILRPKSTSMSSTAVTSVLSSSVAWDAPHYMASLLRHIQAQNREGLRSSIRGKRPPRIPSSANTSSSMGVVPSSLTRTPSVNTTSVSGSNSGSILGAIPRSPSSSSITASVISASAGGSLYKAADEGEACTNLMDFLPSHQLTKTVVDAIRHHFHSCLSDFSVLLPVLAEWLDTFTPALLQDRSLLHLTKTASSTAAARAGFKDGKELRAFLTMVCDLITLLFVISLCPDRLEVCSVEEGQGDGAVAYSNYFSFSDFIESKLCRLKTFPVRITAFGCPPIPSILPHTSISSFSSSSTTTTTNTATATVPGGTDVAAPMASDSPGHGMSVWSEEEAQSFLNRFGAYLQLDVAASASVSRGYLQLLEDVLSVAQLDATFLAAEESTGRYLNRCRVVQDSGTHGASGSDKGNRVPPPPAQQVQSFFESLVSSAGTDYNMVLCTAFSSMSTGLMQSEDMALCMCTMLYPHISPLVLANHLQLADSTIYVPTQSNTDAAFIPTMVDLIYKCRNSSSSSSTVTQARLPSPPYVVYCKYFIALLRHNISSSSHVDEVCTFLQCLYRVLSVPPTQLSLLRGVCSDLLTQLTASASTMRMSDYLTTVLICLLVLEDDVSVLEATSPLPPTLPTATLPSSSLLLTSHRAGFPSDSATTLNSSPAHVPFAAAAVTCTLQYHQAVAAVFKHYWKHVREMARATFCGHSNSKSGASNTSTSMSTNMSTSRSTNMSTSRSTAMAYLSLQQKLKESDHWRRLRRCARVLVASASTAPVCINSLVAVLSNTLHDIITGIATESETGTETGTAADSPAAAAAAVTASLLSDWSTAHLQALVWQALQEVLGLQHALIITQALPLMAIESRWSYVFLKI